MTYLLFLILTLTLIMLLQEMRKLPSPSLNEAPVLHATAIICEKLTYIWSDRIFLHAVSSTTNLPLLITPLQLAGRFYQLHLQLLQLYADYILKKVLAPVINTLTFRLHTDCRALVTRFEQSGECSHISSRVCSGACTVMIFGWLSHCLHMSDCSQYSTRPSECNNNERAPKSSR